MSKSLATSITIDAKDNATNKIRAVAGAAAGLCSQLEAMGPRLDKVFNFFKTGGLGLGLGVNSLVKEPVMAAARYETLGMSMEQAGKNAGYSTAQMREFEQQLQRNGIAMQESRQTLTQLAAANVDLSKAAALARASQDLAVAAGVNSSEAFEKLVRGAVGGQVEALRNLGLMVNFETEYAKMAAGLGTTADKLSEAEKQQARLNATLEASAKYSGIYETAMGTAGKQLGSFTRHISDMQTMIGEAGLDALAHGIFGVNSSLEDANKKLREWQADGTLKEWSEKGGAALRWVADNAGTLSVALGGLLLAQTSAGRGLNTFMSSLTSGEKSFQGWSSGASVLARAEASVAETVLKRKQATASATLEVLNKARAEEADMAVASKSMGVTVQHEAAYRRLIAAEKAHAIALAEATAAQNAYNLAQGKAVASSSLPSQAGDAAAGGISKLKNAATGLVNFFGGPWMAGLTAATVGVYALANADSEAESIAKRYGTTLQGITSDYERLSRGAGEAEQKTKDLSIAQREAVNLREAAARRRLAQAEEDLKTRGTIWGPPVEGVNLEVSYSSEPAQKIYESYKKIYEQFENNPLDAENIQSVVKGIIDLDHATEDLARADTSFWQTEAKEAGSLGDQLKATIVLFRELIDTRKALSISSASFALPTSEELWAKHIAGEKTSLDEAYKKTEESRRNNLLAARNRAVANLSEFKNDSEYQAKAQAVLRQIEKEISSLDNKGVSKSSGASAARRIDQTASAIDTLKGKIDELRGKLNEDKGETYLAKLNKELADYERGLARMPGKSKEQYAALIGDYRELGGQYAQKEREKEIEAHLQVRLDFQRQYADMAGLTSEAVARSLQKQYEDYRKSGVDITQLEEWKADKIRRASRDGFDGALRAMQDYQIEAANMAKSLEGLMGNAFQGMEDAWVKFAATGKISFTDLANSVIADLARIAARQTIGSIVGSLAKGLTGLFASPNAAALSSVGGTAGGVMANEFSAADNMYGIVGYAQHSGGIAGIDYSFKREYPAWLFAEAPRYHKGGIAGLMPGLKQDEITAILRRGEEVVTENDPRHIKNLRQGGGNSIIFKPEINIINNSGEKVSTHESTNANGQPRMDIIIGEIDKALSQKAASGKSQLASTMYKAGGINTSNALYMK